MADRRRGRSGGKASLAEKQREFALRLGDMARSWRGHIDRRLKPLGLSFLQWSTLAQLARAEGEVVQKDLALLVGIDGPTLVGVLDRLVRAGLVERRVASHDRRANTVHLTDSGHRILAAAELELEALRESLLGELLESDIERAIDIFARIAVRARGL